MADDDRNKEQKRSKKIRKKKSSKAVATQSLHCEEDGDDGASFPEGLEDATIWHDVGSDTKSKVLEVLRLEVMSPYMFSNRLLCDKAVTMSRDKNLLPESGVLSSVFDRSFWSDILSLVKVMAAVHTTCTSDDDVYEEIMNGTGALTTAEVIERLKHSDQVGGVSDAQIETFYEIISTQGMDLTSRIQKNDNLAVHFLESLKEKVKFADAIKVRANSNFKLKNLKAAIADYNKAITFCSYNSVLYYNRGVCHLLNDEYWVAVLDSFRALFLCPTWEKPYWRCAEAWHKLDDLSVAMEINLQGQLLASTTLHLRSQLRSFTGKQRTKKMSSNVSNPVEKEPQSHQAPSPEQQEPSPHSTTKTTKKKTASGNNDNKKHESPPTPSHHDKKHSKEVTMSSDSAQDLDKKGKNTESFKGYTELEDLQCPELHPRLTCSEIRRLCNKVQLDWCSPAAYFSPGGSKWETLEPEWVEPQTPTTDPMAEREPMLAKFDEIWCPVLADDGATIIPPTFQYFSDGTIMHSTAY